MIYKAVEVIWIFLADGTGRDIEGSIRGPRGPKNMKLKDVQIAFPQRLSSIISITNVYCLSILSFSECLFKT